MLVKVYVTSTSPRTKWIQWLFDTRYSLLISVLKIITLQQ